MVYVLVRKDDLEKYLDYIPYIAKGDSIEEAKRAPRSRNPTISIPRAAFIEMTEIESVELEDPISGRTYVATLYSLELRI